MASMSSAVKKSGIPAYRLKSSNKSCQATLFEKSNFCPKNQFWQNFTIFSGNQPCHQLKSANPQHFPEIFTQIFFWQFFSWNQSCQQLKSPKPQHFHEISLKTIWQFFSGYQLSKLNCWTKNWRFQTVCQMSFKPIMGIAWLTLRYWMPFRSLVFDLRHWSRQSRKLEGKSNGSARKKLRHWPRKR